MEQREIIEFAKKAIEVAKAISGYQADSTHVRIDEDGYMQVTFSYFRSGWDDDHYVLEWDDIVNPLEQTVEKYERRRLKAEAAKRAHEAAEIAKKEADKERRDRSEYERLRKKFNENS